MKPEEFSAHVFLSENDLTHSDATKAMKTNRKLYYQKLASARLGLALPGLGYDCFRTWEMLTMGVVVVIERGIGLDRTVSLIFFYKKE
jgi:hypothetical protein